MAIALHYPGNGRLSTAHFLSSPAGIPRRSDTRAVGDLCCDANPWHLPDNARCNTHRSAQPNQFAMSEIGEKVRLYK
jgi:hypothetical protein